MCPKLWLAINARGFPSVVGHLRFWGCLRLSIGCATARKQSQQTMSKTCQTRKGGLQTHSVHQICSPFAISNAEAMYQRRHPKCLQGCCGGHVQLICCENGLVSFLLESGGLGCWRLGRTTTVSDVHPRPILCVRKACSSEHNHFLSKIRGHENG